VVDDNFAGRTGKIADELASKRALDSRGGGGGLHRESNSGLGRAYIAASNGRWDHGYEIPVFELDDFLAQSGRHSEKNVFWKPLHQRTWCLVRFISMGFE